jgi:VanZ family protein
VIYTGGYRVTQRVTIIELPVILRNVNLNPPAQNSAAAVARYPQAAYAVWAGVALATAFLSLTPRRTADHIGASLDRFDKLEHLTAYVALGFVSCLPYRTRTYALWAAGSMIVFGAALECLQVLVPGRSCDATDLLANIAGVVIGYWTARIFMWLKGWE